MQTRIDEIISQIKDFNDNSADKVEAFRVRMMGKRGAITELFDQFREVSPEQKRLFGQAINNLKNVALEKITELKSQLDTSDETLESTDFTRPASTDNIGSRHPLTLVRQQILAIFERIGYVVASGPEIEDDWHVFTALNFPPEHPARDMQDTFFVKSVEDKPNDILLRTHTSSIQVRTMTSQKPPLRVICPGRVFRNESISYRAHCIFHQIEGLYIDKGVSFSDLKQTIEYFAKEFFGEKSLIRLRPSYFPFTEPSCEVDVSCNLCGGKGCNVCKYTGWLEIMGAGMVDPNVLEACGIDSLEYSGFAFGMGVERSTMLKYGVRDLRLYFENDIRFLEQFKPVY